MNLIKLVEDLLEAIKEGELAEDADSLLRPNLLMILVLCVPELSFEASRALLVEE